MQRVVFFVMSVVFLLLSDKAFTQTVSDTAAVITGTFTRGVPDEPPISAGGGLLSKPSRPGSSKMAMKPADDNAGGTLSIPNDSILLPAFRKAQLSFYHSIEKKNAGSDIMADSVNAYYQWALKNRQAIITRQQTTGSIIFVMVVVLVLSGLIFSAIQFSIALISSKRKKHLPPETKFKASLTGVEVSSSVMGLIILAISIAFFYLYLTRVYPLVSLDQIPTQSPT